MIKKIILKNFGKFKEKEFNLSPVTVFYGKNESGKTTIFDALMIKLTEIKATESDAKKLKRYGTYNKEKNIILESEIREKIPTEVFKNILAIRAGEISLDLTNKKFSDEISSKIMASEVNLAKLKSEIDKKANSSNKTLTLNKEKDSLIDKYNELKKQLEQQEKKIKENESLKFQLKQLSEQLENKKNEYEQKKARHTQLENEINKLTKAQELKNITESLKKIIEYENLNEKIKTYNEIKEEEIEKFASKEKELPVISKEEELKKNSLRELREKRKACEEKIKNFNSNISEKDIEDIETKLNKINKKNATIEFICKTSAVLIVILTIILVLTLKNLYILPFLSLSIIPFFLLFQNRKIANLEKDQILSKLPEEKRKEEYINQLKFEIKNKANSLKESEKELADLKEKENRLEKEIEELNTKKATIEKELRDFLFNQKATSIKELYERKTNQDAQKKQLEKLKSDITTTFKKSSSEEIKAELLIKKSQLEAEGVFESDYNDDNLKRLKIEKDRTLREIELLMQEIRILENKISENKGKSSNISEILNQYKELEKQIILTENKIYEIITTQNAYFKISSIISEIMKDVSLTFNQLAKEISNEFGEFFPHFKEVDISSINNIEDFSVKDKYEQKRRINHLSTGTRDMFLLAFRILLAKKFGIGKFLILDEPFLALDNERIEKMLDIIEKFYKENKWQLIFLTKDLTLKELILKKFGQIARAEDLNE
ncbi:MAG: ATP-binding protein [Brevinematia bacterium]